MEKEQPEVSDVPGYGQDSIAALVSGPLYDLLVPVVPGTNAHSDLT